MSNQNKNNNQGQQQGGQNQGQQNQKHAADKNHGPNCTNCTHTSKQGQSGQNQGQQQGGQNQGQQQKSGQNNWEKNKDINKKS